MPSTAVDTTLSAWLRRLPHYLYLVDLIPGKRVLEIGCGSGVSAQFLANHGAGRVVAIDRSMRKVSEARARYRQTNLEFRCEDPGSVELEDASFDVVFVPDGIDALRRRSVLGEVRRLLARDGYLVLCGSSADRRGAPGGASFYEFRERLERTFAPVRMVAQMPFVGFSLVEYGDETSVPDIQLDTSLCELEGGDLEPCDYVAVCGGPATAPLRGFTVVQVPDTALETVGGAIGARGTAGQAPVFVPAPPDEHDGMLARELRLRLERSIEERARAYSQAQELRDLIEDLRRQLAEAQAARPSGASPADTVEQPVVIEDDGTDEGEAAGEASASEQIARALAAHREVVRSLEIAVEEGQAYAEELRAEGEEQAARAVAAERALAHARGRADRLDLELREWRTRASTAEGRLMRLARAAADPGPGASTAEIGARAEALGQELARVTHECREAEARLGEVSRTAADGLARAERERDEAAARARKLESDLARARTARDNGGATSGGNASGEKEVRERIGRLETELGNGRDLLRHIEDGLAELEKAAAREATERAPSAWAAHRDQQLRELSAELGIKDAEITILHVGVSALRARMKELIGEVRRAAGSMRGRSAPEMLDVMERLNARLAAFEERE